MTHEHVVPEFSRPILIDQLPAKVSRHNIEAEPSERAAVAKRLDLLELTSLNAKIEMEPIARTGLIRVNGRLTARVVQACVVTLAPLAATLEEAFELTFGPPEAALDEEGEIEVSWDQSDPPDLIVDGCIDIGIWLWRSIPFRGRPKRRSNRRRRGRKIRMGKPIPSRCCRRYGKKRSRGKHPLALGGLFG